jgi:hypothetical protein
MIIARYPPIAIQRRSHLAEPLGAESAPVRKLVVSFPTPRYDHREHQNPALAKQVLINIPIVLADFVGHMGDVELDRPAATCLQVYELQPVLRPEQVARVRLAVQQLLGGAAIADRAPQTSQRVAEQLPVSISQLRSEGAVGNQSLRLRDSIREVRRGHIDLPHAGMQPLERLRVLGWRDNARRYRLIVGPQRDREAVTHVDARLHSRLKRSHRAIGFGEPPSDLNLELCACLMRHVRDPSKNVTRQ